MTNLDIKVCVFNMNTSQKICPRPGWPYELSVFVITLLSAANKIVISRSGNINAIRALGYTANLSLSTQADFSIMRELYEDEADLSAPYMLLTESRAKLVHHLGALFPVEPVVFFRKEIVAELNFSLLRMFSFPYLAMFLLPFIGTGIIFRIGLKTPTPRRFRVSRVARVSDNMVIAPQQSQTAQYQTHTRKSFWNVLILLPHIL